MSDCIKDCNKRKIIAAQRTDLPCLGAETMQLKLNLFLISVIP